MLTFCDSYKIEEPVAKHEHFLVYLLHAGL